METPNDSVIVPPSTIGEIAVHLGYLRRDIQQLSAKFDEVSKAYVTHEEFNTLEKTVVTLKTFMDTSEGAAAQVKKDARSSSAFISAIVSGAIALIAAIIKAYLKI